MRALLAVGGEAPPLSRIRPFLADSGLVCAADSGLDLLHAWGLAPDLIVGDMDSLSSASLLAEYPRAELHLLERAKDLSDTEAGLELCHERGAEEIVIVGGGGGRLDHLLAIRALFERRVRPSSWHLAEDSLFLVPEGRALSFDADPGVLISVFPLAGGCEGMQSRGLRWPLEGLSWTAGHYGLSNESLGGRVEIGAGRGPLLVVRSWRPLEEGGSPP